VNMKTQANLKLLLNQRDLRITIAGRSAVDMQLEGILDETRDDSISVLDSGTAIIKITDPNDQTKTYTLSVDSEPSDANDKVNSLGRLDSLVAKFGITENGQLYPKVGGGGPNSAFALKTLSGLGYNVMPTLMTTSNTLCYINGQEFDAQEKLHDKGVRRTLFLNKTRLQYNALTTFLSGEKLVIRSPSFGRSYEISREDVKHSVLEITESKGFLANTWGKANRDLTQSVIRAIGASNEICINGYKPKQERYTKHELEEELGLQLYDLSQLNPDYRVAATVITPSDGMSRDFILRNIAPYSSAIFNKEDFLKIICKHVASKTPVEEDYNIMCEGMIEIANGARTIQGSVHKLGAQNNIYVSDGKHGYFTVEDGNVVRYSLDDECLNAFKEGVTNKTGAGDFFAGGIIYAETARMFNPKELTAVANSAVFDSFGLNTMILGNQVVKYEGPKLFDNIKFD